MLPTHRRCQRSAAGQDNKSKERSHQALQSLRRESIPRQRPAPPVKREIELQELASVASLPRFHYLCDLAAELFEIAIRDS